MVMHRQEEAQAVIEYALLVAIAIIALVGTVNFVSKLNKNNNAFDRHFMSASELIIHGVHP